MLPHMAVAMAVVMMMMMTMMIIMIIMMMVMVMTVMMMIFVEGTPSIPRLGPRLPAVPPLSKCLKHNDESGILLLLPSWERAGR